MRWSWPRLWREWASNPEIFLQPRWAFTVFTYCNLDIVPRCGESSYRVWRNSSPSLSKYGKQIYRIFKEHFLLQIRFYIQLCNNTEWVCRYRNKQKKDFFVLVNQLPVIVVWWKAWNPEAWVLLLLGSPGVQLTSNRGPLLPPLWRHWTCCTESDMTEAT